MTVITITTLLPLFLPFLLSLAGQGNKAKMLCLLTCSLSLLFAAEPDRAALAWLVGMGIALVSVWERIRQRYPV